MSQPGGNQVLGWGGTTPVAEWLRREPYRFEFFQAVHLLEASSEVRLRARGSFAFPPSEIALLEGGELTASILALDGALGPLPAALAEDYRRDEAFAEFLDIFHQRLLWLLYRIRQAHAPSLGNQGPLDAILLAIGGLGLPALRQRQDLPDAALTRYAAWLSRETRPAHGLEKVLSDFAGIGVRVRQFVGRWMKLDEHQQTRLGASGLTLGRGTVLGRRAWNDGAAVEVALGPLDARAFGELLPGAARYRAVCGLIRLYLRNQCEFRLVLAAAPGALGPGNLGRARLGYTTLLGTRLSAKTVEVRVSYPS